MAKSTAYADPARWHSGASLVVVSCEVRQMRCPGLRKAPLIPQWRPITHYVKIAPPPKICMLKRGENISPSFNIDQ